MALSRLFGVYSICCVMLQQLECQQHQQQQHWYQCDSCETVLRTLRLLRVNWLLDIGFGLKVYVYFLESRSRENASLAANAHAAATAAGEPRTQQQYGANRISGETFESRECFFFFAFFFYFFVARWHGHRRGLLSYERSCSSLFLELRPRGL